MNRCIFLTKRAAIVMAACLLFEAQSAQDDVAVVPSIEWATAAAAPGIFHLEVQDLPLRTLTGLQSSDWTLEQWHAALSVYVVTGDAVMEANQPPLLGSYRIQDWSLRFDPQFALEAGIKYRAVLHLSHLPGMGADAGMITATFQVPVRHRKPFTVVSAVYPSADALPENLLKFYLHFSSPMSRGKVYQHIHLLNAKGGAVELPFLELDEELWSPDMTRLTLFIDPGRIKRGVRPLEEVGPALESGGRFTLVIDAALKDGEGLPLKAGFNKSFRVTPPDREALDVGQWNIRAPRAGTMQALSIRFPKPLDNALARRAITVHEPSGDRVEGEVALLDHERRWVFTPARSWSPGRHSLIILTTIEDLAGNNIGKPFEVNLVEGTSPTSIDPTVSVSFVPK